MMHKETRVTNSQNFDNSYLGGTSDEARKTLGSWIPTDPSKCLQPKDVAKCIFNMVEMMEVADIQEISLESVPVKK